MKLQICALLLAMLMAAGCKHKAEEHGHDHEEDHEAHHEVESVQITVWSANYEVFTEYEVPVVGEGVPFLIHLTELKSGSAVESPIEIKASGPEGAGVQISSVVSRPGLYIPKITFPKFGEWKLNLVVAGEAISLPAIQVFKNQEEARKAKPVTPPEGITFLKEQQWKLRLKTASVRTEVVTQSVRLLGKVSPKPGSTAVVSAPTTGRILAPAGSRIALPGQPVKQGEVLVLLEPVFSESTAKLLEAEAEAIRAKAALDLAQINVQRTRQLAASEAKSPRELQEAEFSFKQAQASYEAAAALQSTYKKLVPGEAQATNLKQIELRAPIDGVITDAAHNLGKVVTAQQSLFTLANPGEFWIEAHAPEKLLRHLAKSPQALLKDGTELAFVFRGMEIEEATRSVPIVFAFNNSNSELLLGQMLEMQLKTKTSTNSIAIPETAIIEENGRPVAFVQLAGETFEKRQLELGMCGGGIAQVITGLNEGERIVIEGAYAVRLASVSTAIPAHEHPH